MADAEALLNASGVPYEREIASGEPAPALIDMAHRHSCDAIIMGARGRGALRSALACISVVEVDESGESRFRIAGSRLREIFGMEVRGMRVAEIAGAHGECYVLGLSAALERGEPVGGVIEIGGRIHAWLRLPLAGEDGQLNQVLCHDELLPSRRMLRPLPQGGGLIQHPRPRYAA